MSESWIKGKLGDFITLQRGYDLPSYKREEGIVPVVTSSGINGTHSIAKAKGPGVVMGRYGTIGEIFYIENDYWPHNTSLFVKDFKNNHPRFIYYFLKTLHYQDHNDKSSVPGLNRNDLHAIDVVLPPSCEQYAIAQVLGSLDDKINLNRHMNETMEEIARTIFKSWFVNFNPVHAKSRGEQPPSMDTATTDLFPDHFENSELGLIPAGWRVEPLSNHVNARKGLSYKGDGLAEVSTGLPMHNLNSVYEGGGYKYEGMKYYSGEYQERHIAKAGDVIVANTEQGHNLLLIGYPAIIPQKYDEGLYSHHLYRVTPHEDSHITPRFIYYLLKTGIFHETIAGYTNGTTVNMLPSDGLEKPLFVVPSPEIIQSFDELVVPMLNIMEQNHEQTQQLAETRDVLLPKLVSGEVRIGEVNNYIEDIA